MKRVLAGAALLFLFACSDDPTQVVTKPQFDIAQGDNATWYFEGHVIYDNSVWADVGDVVKGTVHFQTTSGDLYASNPCSGNRDADVEFKFTVNGVPYTISGIGSAYSWRMCEPGTYVPSFQINTYRTGGPITGWMNLYNANDSKDFPLTPPPLADVYALGVGEGGRGFQMYTYENNTGFFVYIDLLTRADAWRASGPGTVTLLSDGTASPAGMSYAMSGDAVFNTQTWTFQTTAASAGPVTINYKYEGLHAWFQVRAFLHPFIIHNGSKSYLAGIDAGPADCCEGPPSDGFNYTGSTTFNVAVGDTYGFEIGGSNYDYNSFLQGTLQFVLPDNTPPVIQPVITGTLGNRGWYTSNVHVAWNVTDDESAITSPACAPTDVTTDTHEAIASCSATSAGGTASKSVTIMRDATKPIVAFDGVQSSYTVDQSVTITCTANDAMSGLVSDNCITAGVSSPAYLLTLGSHHLSANASDNAGNTSSASADFTVTVTSGSVCNLVQQWVTQRGVANSLCVKLNQSSARAFNNEVKAQTGKFVPADKASILTALASALLGA